MLFADFFQKNPSIGDIRIPMRFSNPYKIFKNDISKKTRDATVLKSHANIIMV